jgi:hypothetical protein
LRAKASLAVKKVLSASVKRGMTRMGPITLLAVKKVLSSIKKLLSSASGVYGSKNNLPSS